MQKKQITEENLNELRDMTLVGSFSSVAKKILWWQVFLRLCFAVLWGFFSFSRRRFYYSKQIFLNYKTFSNFSSLLLWHSGGFDLLVMVLSYEDLAWGERMNKNIEICCTRFAWKSLEVVKFYLNLKLVAIYEKICSFVRHWESPRRTPR